jgi:hypothetical protein
VKWKTQRAQDDNPRFTRKFNKWEAKNFTYAGSLAMSLMHPISKLRLESHLAKIRVKELPSGFRVLSADAVLIESLPDVQKIIIRDRILFNQTNQPEKICCEAMYGVEAIDAAKNTTFLDGYSFGPYSNLAAVQEEVATLNGRRVELIKTLNKDL